MKTKKIIYLFAGFLSAASASYADLTSVTLDSSNASNASISTYYRWVPLVDPTNNTLDSTVAITYSESNLTLLANRGARDWSGSITLAADTSGNAVRVGSTATTNTLGFSNATITGGNTNTSLTFTTYSDSTYNPGYYRIVNASAMTINQATVTFTDANMAINTGTGSSPTITVNGGGTLIWNIGAFWNSSLVTDTTVGLNFSSATKGDGNIVVGASAGLNNYGFNNVNVSFASGVGSTVNFTGTKALNVTNSTFNMGTRALSFVNSGSYTLSGSNFVGTDKSTSTVGVSGSSVTATSLTAGNATVNLTSSSTTATVNALTLDNATVNISAATTAALGTFAGTGTSAATSIVNVSGTSGITGGTLTLNNITVNLNSALSGTLSVSGTSGGFVNLNANSALSAINGADSHTATIGIGTNVAVTSAARINAQPYNFVLNSGSSLTVSGYNLSGTAGNNILTNLTMASGSTLTVAGGLRISGVGSVVNGTINLNGSGRNGVIYNADEFIFAISGAAVTFGASAALNQAYQSVGATNWTTGTMVVNSATGSLKFGNVMNFGRSSTTTLNTTDAIISGSGDLSATSQATSTFRLNSYSTSGTGAKFIVNAANNVGSFDLAQSGNKLYLQFGEGGSLTVGADAGLTSFTGAYLGTDTIELVGDILNKLRVYDLTEAQIQDYFTSSTGNTIYTVAAGDGSYWVNTVVPEPAEWAALFGAIALGAAIYRRRGNNR